MRGIERPRLQQPSGAAAGVRPRRRAVHPQGDARFRPRAHPRARVLAARHARVEPRHQGEGRRGVRPDDHRHDAQVPRQPVPAEGDDPRRRAVRLRQREEPRAALRGAGGEAHRQGAQGAHRQLEARGARARRAHVPVLGERRHRGCHHGHRRARRRRRGDEGPQQLRARRVAREPPPPHPAAAVDADGERGTAIPGGVAGAAVRTLDGLLFAARISHRSRAWRWRRWRRFQSPWRSRWQPALAA
mmetsp:Transcript_13912/g.43325  ORF Transcript_13912/g.43325 Transcript_13912/m.43325 type:complete len:245 (-) Transcript_13912:140-874(-)